MDWLDEMTIIEVLTLYAIGFVIGLNDGHVTYISSEEEAEPDNDRAD